MSDYYRIAQAIFFITSQVNSIRHNMAFEWDASKSDLTRRANNVELRILTI